MTTDRAVFDHMVACLKLWDICIDDDLCFWDGMSDDARPISEAEVTRRLRQELRIAFSLSEVAKKKAIRNLISVMFARVRARAQVDH